MNPYEQSITSLLSSHLAPIAAAAAARQIAALASPTVANIAAIIEAQGVAPGTAAMLAGQVMSLPWSGAASPPVGPAAGAQPPVGQALLPVTLPAAPGLAWQLPGTLPPPAPPAPATATSWWKWLIGVVLTLIVLALLGLGVVGLGLAVWRGWSTTDQLSAIQADTRSIATALPGVVTDVRRTASASERTAVAGEGTLLAMPVIQTDLARTATAAENAASQLTATEAANQRRHQQVLGAIQALKRQPIEVTIRGGAAPAAQAAGH